MLMLVVILVPVALILNWRYSKSLNKEIRELPEDAKKLLKEDIRNEEARYITYRILGENFFKKDDFLNRLFTDESFWIHLRNDDLSRCIKLKKCLRVTMKFLVFLFLISVIMAGIVFALFSNNMS